MYDGRRDVVLMFSKSSVSDNLQHRTIYAEFYPVWSLRKSASSDQTHQFSEQG